MTIRSKTLFRTLRLACLALLLVGFAAQAAEEGSVGLVVKVTGQVSATLNGTTRSLARGADVFVGDTLTTSADGYAQLRLSDGAIIALKADTIFEISDYSFQASNGQQDSATMSLIQGGFRTITGTIGDVNKEAYRVETPFATIGIRGTDHLGELTPQGLVAGVFRGGTQLDNPFGTLPLGVDANFDVGLVSDPNSPPVGLLD